MKYRWSNLLLHAKHSFSSLNPTNTHPSHSLAILLRSTSLLPSTATITITPSSSTMPFTPSESVVINTCSNLFLRSSDIVLCKSELSFSSSVGNLQGTLTLKSKLYSTWVRVKRDQSITFDSYEPHFIQVWIYTPPFLGDPTSSYFCGIPSCLATTFNRLATFKCWFKLNFSGE